MQELQITEDMEIAYTEWNGKQYISTQVGGIQDSTEFDLPNGTKETLPVTVGTLGNCTITIDEDSDNLGRPQPDGSSPTYFQLLKVSYDKIATKLFN